MQLCLSQDAIRHAADVLREGARGGLAARITNDLSRPIAIKPADPVRSTRYSRHLLFCERPEKTVSIRISLHACRSPARVRQSGSRKALRLGMRNSAAAKCSNRTDQQ
jgi:hypothetical protein